MKGLRNSRPWKNLHYGINKARKLLDNTKTANKILIIFSNGRVDGDYHNSGFTLSRIESVGTRAKGIHIVAVSILNRHTDLRTLHAVASYPKSENTIADIDGMRLPCMLVERIKNTINSGMRFFITIFVFAPHSRPKKFNQ